MTTNKRNKRVGIVLGWHVLLIAAVLFTLHDRGYFDKKPSGDEMPAASVQNGNTEGVAALNAAMTRSISDLESSGPNQSPEGVPGEVTVGVDRE